MNDPIDSTATDTEENTPRPSIKERIKDSFYSLKVLVVDDEKRIRDACKRFLVSEGCEVDQAENGSICMEMISAAHYDIILLDLMMPGIAGMEVLKKVKALHPDTVVIVITGYATLEHSIEAMKNGAYDFLSKPFTPQELSLVISKAIDFLWTLQDIATEKSRMRVMVNSLCNGVLTTDNQKHVVLANPAFLKLMGCRKNRIIGQPVTDLIQDDRLLGLIDRTMDQPETEFADHTEELVIPDATEDGDRIIGVRCIPFRDRLNRSLGAITLLQDITALKRIDQLKSDFVSMVAHELKSPLNSIMMQLNVVLDGLAGELTDKQREILTKNYDRIQSLTTLTSELLDLSKMESGLINQEREKIDLVRIMADRAELYMEKANAKSISLETRAPEHAVHVMGNRTNIEEVFSNLISNAIRYTPEKGRIRVAVAEKGETARIEVADTGYGISKDEIPNIFNKFYRVKTSQTRHINGTGLGLSIVKKIIEAHNGAIDVTSTLEKGTTFKVTLPGVV